VSGGPDGITEHHLAVTRTARYCHLAGGGGLHEVWYVLHGYGQLARSFLEACAPLAGEGRAVIAPEALSRYYVASDAASHADARVGASWMTREDRDAEIRDCVAYLDALRLVVEAPLGPVRSCVLGFSQGAATAARWAALGARPLDRVVLWAGLMPSDVDLAEHRARFARTDVVVGRGDEYTAVHAAAHERRLHDQGIVAPTRWFDGGHRLDRATLRALVGDGTEEHG